MVIRPRPFSMRRMPGLPLLALACFFALYLPLPHWLSISFQCGIDLLRGCRFGRWYEAAWENLCPNAAIRSLVVATFFLGNRHDLLATMAALATTRQKPYRGQSVHLWNGQPATDDPGNRYRSRAAHFLWRLIKESTQVYGFGYLLTAHTAFCIPFAYIPIRARLEGMDHVLKPRRQMICMRRPGVHSRTCYPAFAAAGHHCRRNAVIRNIV